MEFLIKVLQPCVSKGFVDNVRFKTSYVQQFITGRNLILENQVANP